MNTPDVSIIIPTKNGERELRRLLPRLEEQAYTGDVQLVVVDSSSTDNTVEVATSFGAKVHTIDGSEFHHGQTRNLGAEIADNELMVFTTDDALPIENHWLRSLVRPLVEDDVEAVYGKQVAYPNAKPPDKFFYSYFYPDTPVTLDESDISDPAEFFLNNIYISDVCAAFHRDVWEDNQFGDHVVWSEDKEFAYRLLKGGGRIRYEPTAGVYHSHDYSLRSLFERRFRDGQGYAMLSSSGGGDFFKSGSEYVVEEIKFLFNRQSSHWIPFVIFYNTIHFVAFNLGNLYHRTVMYSDTHP